MKVVILAGGYGTRLSEYTESIPKPMVTIGAKPIIWHIMRTYAHFGHNDFYIALGYQAQVVKDYFLRYRSLNSNFTIDLKSGSFTPHQVDEVDWRVTLVDTGLQSMTGGRIKKISPFLGQDPFLITYGDGLANIDINDLIAFHKGHGKMVTVTAVRPAARFGELGIDGNKVTSFREKPQVDQGWINGGYFVVNPEFVDLITDEKTVLEREPLETVAKMGELMAYSHEGFWQCMDTKRDREALEDLWSSGKAPWKL